MNLPSVRFRIEAHKDAGLRKAPAVLRKNLKESMQSVATTLQVSARTRMRKDTGTQRDRLKTKVTVKGPNVSLIVFSVLIQSFVDAYGLKRGVFPDFRVNSKLYNWAKRKLKGHVSETTKTYKVPGSNKVPKRRIAKVKTVSRITTPGTLNSNQRSKAKNTDIRRLAFLVARSIFKSGIRSSKWNVKTLEANKTNIIRDLSNAFVKTANELKRL